MLALVLSVMLSAVGGGQNGAAPQPVTVKAPDGVTLKASYFAAAKPGPAILLLHQCNSERSSWTPFAAAAAARGYHVLALDFRGFGESGGERPEQRQEQQRIIDETWPGDVDAAFAWLTSQPGVDRTRVAAAGASCGVNQSVQLARRHPEVRTLVLLSGPVTRASREYLRDTPALPLLAAASDEDGDALVTMRWILGWSRNPANRLLEYRAAGHGTEMLAAEKRLQPAMFDWLDAHLRGPAATASAAAAPAAPSPIEQFWNVLTAPDGITRAREIYLDTKRRSPDLVLFPETELNLYGYQLLQQGRPKEAVAVFQLNVEAYPGSANTYDSLSDAYVADGNREEALRNAEKAVDLLAADTRVPPEFRAAIRESAENKIKALKKR